ncbi:MAG: polyribonucleotide nucleotidyltransferase [Planctomycetota bacterium]|nr:polyribonucleotide nucleotidyltransferase [Planctomycetota bacterium]
MGMSKVRVERKIGNEILSFETGFIAKQADACIIAQYGETVVLSAISSGAGRPGLDFFQLMCDYRERTAAAGKFPGGFIKREGRPSTKETLTSRLTDRPIRPLFPKGYDREVMCQSTVVASDALNDADVLAMNGIATGLLISPLPFQGQIASVRVGRIEGELVTFPNIEQLEESDLDMIVSGSAEEILMIEGFAREMPEDEMVDAILFAHKSIKEICELQDEFVAQCTVEKQEFLVKEDDGLFDTVKDKYFEDFKTAQLTPGKLASKEAVSALKERIVEEMIPDAEAEDAICASDLQEALGQLKSAVVRALIIGGTRPDGRKHDELRNIESYVDVMPRVHGSAVFQRGETQALITVVLGTGKDEQRVDGLTENYSKKFMLDYNFPGYSVGEAKPNRGPSRRDIGHGMLAERSIKPVLPDPDDFPYTIRVISDITESNGSSSQATICGTTLGLMAAGVPISNPVAGISIGLVQEGDQNILLTDIQGDEDHYGDMDFKVAGTQNGITGIQLDLKIDGISEQIIRDALTQARVARIEIMKNMIQAIDSPRTETSEYAPRLMRTKINPDKIGALIGPGGKNIRHIQESTGTVIEVDDEGNVTVASTNAEWADEAMRLVESYTATVQVGKIYDGTVSSIKDFGVFVEILPGRDGLCHVSELSTEFISDVSKLVNEGDTMKVKCIGVDDHDRVKLSRRAALEELGEEDDWGGQESSGDSKGSDGDGRSGGRERGGDRRGGGRGRGGDRRGGRRDRGGDSRSGGRERGRRDDRRGDRDDRSGDSNDRRGDRDDRRGDRDDRRGDRDDRRGDRDDRRGDRDDRGGDRDDRGGDRDDRGGDRDDRRDDGDGGGGNRRGRRRSRD